jgi:hypothetical protein
MIIVASPVVRLYFVNGARLEQSLECRRRGGEIDSNIKDTLFATRVPMVNPIWTFQISRNARPSLSQTKAESTRRDRACFRNLFESEQN